MSDSLPELLENLYSSKNEDQVIESLKKLIKSPHSCLQYKESINSNPYFKSLSVDIKNSILEEMDFYINSISEEIKEIDNILEDSDDSFELHSLRIDCVSLLKEISKRKSDLLNL